MKFLNKLMLIEGNMSLILVLFFNFSFFMENSIASSRLLFPVQFSGTLEDLKIMSGVNNDFKVNESDPRFYINPNVRPMISCIFWEKVEQLYVESEFTGINCIAKFSDHNQYYISLATSTLNQVKIKLDIDQIQIQGPVSDIQLTIENSMGLFPKKQKREGSTAPAPSVSLTEKQYYPLYFSALWQSGGREFLFDLKSGEIENLIIDGPVAIWENLYFQTSKDSTYAGSNKVVLKSLNLHGESEAVRSIKLNNIPKKTPHFSYKRKPIGYIQIKNVITESSKGCFQKWGQAKLIGYDRQCARGHCDKFWFTTWSFARFEESGLSQENGIFLDDKELLETINQCFSQENIYR